jgi:hypothetical protein
MIEVGPPIALAHAPLETSTITSTSTIETRDRPDLAPPRPLPLMLGLDFGLFMLTPGTKPFAKLRRMKKHAQSHKWLKECHL